MGEYSSFNLSLIFITANFMPHRLNGTELVRVNEGEEPKDLCNLLGKKDIYVSLANGKFNLKQWVWVWCDTTEMAGYWLISSQKASKIHFGLPLSCRDTVYSVHSPPL